jgi:hypothetical protein
VREQNAFIALKFKYKAMDEIPAEHLNLYVERDGVHVLDVEGANEFTEFKHCPQARGGNTEFAAGR